MVRESDSKTYGKLREAYRRILEKIVRAERERDVMEEDEAWQVKQTEEEFNMRGGKGEYDVGRGRIQK